MQQPNLNSDKFIDQFLNVVKERAKTDAQFKKDVADIYKNYNNKKQKGNDKTTISQPAHPQ